MMSWAIRHTTLLCGLAILMPLFDEGACADIINWQTGETIPGTEGIVPGPGVQLRRWDDEERNLRFADFAGLDLSNAKFNDSWLHNARFKGANLLHASFRDAILNDVDFTDAVVTDAIFGPATERGFTMKQLYATASYQAKDLGAIYLDNSNVSGWNFAEQNLANASFSGALIDSADFTDAVIRDVSFNHGIGFSKAQLYSSASYKKKDLGAVGLADAELTGVEFAGHNLDGARFWRATLTSANLTQSNLHNGSFRDAILDGAVFTDAIVTEADFTNATSTGFTKEQLYSTGSYRTKHIEAIDLTNNDLTRWDFSGQNLSLSRFIRSTLANANFTRSDLQNGSFSFALLNGADFTDAVIRNVDFDGAEGFTKGQLYSTASYQAKNLGAIGLATGDLTGWNFVGQDLEGARFVQATLTNAKLGQANLRNSSFLFALLNGADFADAIVTGSDLSMTTSTGFTKEQLYSTASYKAKELGPIGLAGNDLTGWDFADQNLEGAILSYFSINFDRRSTFIGASFRHADLSDASVAFADLTGADFSHADLSRVQFYESIFDDTTAVAADLRGATGIPRFAVMDHAIWPDGSIKGLALGTSFGDSLVIRDNDLGVTVQDAFVIRDYGLLELRLADNEWTSTVTVSTRVTPQLGGTLRINFDSTADLSTLPGATFSLFHWNAAPDESNRFDRIELPPGTEWDLSELYTTGEVTLLSIPEPATFAAMVLGILFVISVKRRPVTGFH